MNRRNLASLAVLIPIAACATSGISTQAQTEQAIAQAQAALTAMAAILPIVSPDAASYQPYLAQASAALNTLSTTMSAARAKPIIQQITVSLNGAADAADNAAALIPNPTQRAAFQRQIAQARAVVAILAVFATVAAPGMVGAESGGGLYVRAVR